jgi:hypothetical protein
MNEAQPGKRNGEPVHRSVLSRTCKHASSYLLQLL